MHRAVKFGLYGTVLLGLVGGTAAWTLVDKTVHVQIDGQDKTVHTVSSTVAGALQDAGHRVGPHDFVAPSAQSAVHDGSEVVLKQGRQLMINVDGRREMVWTTSDTVDSALADLGYSTQDFSSVSRSQRLPLSLTDITLRTPKVVTVKHDGRSQTVSSTDATVGAVLADLGVQVGARDKLTPAPATPLTNGLVITLGRVTSKKVRATQPIPFPTSKQPAPTLPVGQTTVLTPGVPGSMAVTYLEVFVDGKLTGRTVLTRTTVQAPTPQVVGFGSLKVATVPSGGQQVIAPGSAQAIAQSLLPSYGFSSDQMSCLIPMWDNESGWRSNANNSGSGAYGIPQALPGSKMASAGADWQTNPATQIKWGLGYIKARYGTPCDAWAYWQANGNY